MKKINKCNCHSYNWDFWKDKEEIIKKLVWVAADWEKIYEDICIDACIADTIKLLWSEWVNTMSSCCGHWKRNPSIVFWSIEDAVKWKKLLKEYDKREFDLSYWARVAVM